MNRNDERKAWIEFMAAAMAHYASLHAAADRADMALALLKQRFPTLPASWQHDPAPFV